MLFRSVRTVVNGPLQRRPLPGLRRNQPRRLDPIRRTLFPRIVSGRDAGQAYSLLLPLDYSPTRRYPLVLILDSRGDALVPLARFGPPAARLGFVVMSSYNSASDGPVEPNIGAVNTMLGDAWRALSIDTTRVYLVGFSGTARFS